MTFIFYSNVSAKENKKVFVAGHYSSEGSVHVGVPQGSDAGASSLQYLQKMISRCVFRRLMLIVI